MAKRTLFIASDHAGYELKTKLIRHFENGINESGDQWTWKDLGPVNADRVDYPDYAHRLVKELLADHESRGVLICGSGQGMAIAANRHHGVRAALAWSESSAELARSHNDANVLCLGARLLDEATVYKILSVFLKAPFERGRHVDRLRKIEILPRST